MTKQDKPNIIFTTSYEQYAIRVFETFSIDYLLKSIKEERLHQSIEKLHQFGKIASSIDFAGLQQTIQQLKSTPKATALPVRTGDRINVLKFETISYLEAEDKYVFIHTIDGQKHIIDQHWPLWRKNYPLNFTGFRSPISSIMSE